MPTIQSPSLVFSPFPANVGVKSQRWCSHQRLRSKLNKYFKSINLFLSDDELYDLFILLYVKKKQNNINFEFSGLDIKNLPTKKLIIKIEN